MDSIVTLLSVVATSKRIHKNTLLLCQGDIPHCVYFVQSGCIKAYRTNASGDEQVAGFKTAGDIFPEHWVFGQSSHTMYSYEAVEDSDVLTIERDVFHDMLDQHPDEKQKYFDYMVKAYTGLMIQVSALEQSYAVDKILMILYYFMVRYGHEEKPGEYWLSMKLSQSTIAGFTGLTRETVTAEMVKLKKQNVVYYDAKKFIIYKEMLKSKIGSDTFTEIQVDE